MSRTAKKQQARLRRLGKLVEELVEECEGVCEICNRGPDWRGLAAAHIERRDRTGENDTRENIIIACGRCHDHTRYFPDGLCISKDEAKAITARRNGGRRE